jgi:di/tricarboxylate transporter
VHLRETRYVIDYLQDLVQRNPVAGFWTISLAAFVISPFLTNLRHFHLYFYFYLNLHLHYTSISISISSLSTTLYYSLLLSTTLALYTVPQGVCLLFVEPILSAFDGCSDGDEEGAEGEGEGESALLLEAGGAAAKSAKKPASLLDTSDCVYFLMGLACSANIGSALTYTGNPQNMIVASDSIDVLPSYKVRSTLHPSCWRRGQPSSPPTDSQATA